MFRLFSNKRTNETWFGVTLLSLFFFVIALTGSIRLRGKEEKRREEKSSTMPENCRFIGDVFTGALRLDSKVRYPYDITYDLLSRPIAQKTAVAATAPGLSFSK